MANKNTENTPKEPAFDVNKIISKKKALGMVAVTPRDTLAMSKVYKNYEREHKLGAWLAKFEKDGFNILNSDELKKLIK